jgi:hypothetical protein
MGGSPAPKALGVGEASLLLKTKTGAREPHAPVKQSVLQN